MRCSLRQVHLCGSWWRSAPWQATDCTSVPSCMPQRVHGLELPDPRSQSWLGCSSSPKERFELRHLATQIFSCDRVTSCRSCGLNPFQFHDLSRIIKDAAVPEPARGVLSNIQEHAWWERPSSAAPSKDSRFDRNSWMFKPFAMA